ncbi:MAG: hypothetical protein OEM49_06685 [Myxococcales bacterium]|nr:hypothetical protein [Myxococcales bacterium]MDH5567190.1 hypothetical protein [Myxococcales bacterium]
MRAALPLRVLLLFALLFAAHGSEAQTPESSEAIPPPVDLEALLRLPKGASSPAAQPRREEATRAVWEARFAEARGELENSQQALAKAQDELAELASGSEAWQMAAPGMKANPENSPISFKLRQEIRKYREDVERAERALTDLRIEANLAGVPEDWQN